jgi:hypothetical protein
MFAFHRRLKSVYDVTLRVPEYRHTTHSIPLNILCLNCLPFHIFALENSTLEERKKGY